MLIGEKVILRPLSMKDLSKVNSWRNDVELIKLTMGIRFPKTLEMDEEWFNQVLRDKSNRNIYWAIDTAIDAKFIGLISLTNVDYISGIANWGFIIGDTELQGKGYSREVVSLFCDYSFNTLNLRKLWGFMIDCNVGAKKMHQRIGSINEGILKDHVYYQGTYHDVIIVSLFKTHYYRHHPEGKQ